MALTRAQLLAGNSTQGVVLPGQVQAVTAGAGISIDANGVISFNSATSTGLVKLNNGAAYNSYVWPNTDGVAKTFLQTDGAGILTWTNANGFAVVTVSSSAPVPTDIGELWFDCTTGSLKVWQNCVGTPSPNWFNVGQPGLPALPSNTTAVPAFTGGNGTQATPYSCTVTTTSVGSSVFLNNTVTITGLAPFQFVPIVDLNAIANGGRFSFSNNYADASGSLTFQTIFDDSPSSPAGTSYTAAIKVGYGTVYINAIINVVAALSVTSGSIAGLPAVGTTLTYTNGVASGGVPGYTYAWTWRKVSDNSVLQTNGSTYVVVSGLVNDAVYVRLIATDSVSSTATADTSVFPTPPATIQVAGITNAVAPTIVPGTANFTWADGASNLSSTGCIEFSVNGGAFTQASTAVANGNTVTTQWKTGPAGTCGDAPDGTTITGSLSNGTRTTNFTLLIDKVPSAFTLSPATETANAGAVTTSNPSFTVAGTNSPAYIWGAVAPTGSTPQFTVNNGVTWSALPAAPGTATVNPGATVKVRFTAVTPLSTETLTVDVGASATAKQSGTFAVTVTAAGITNAVAPTTIPGTANFTWANGAQNLTGTGCIEFKVGAGSFTQASTPVVNGSVITTQWRTAPAGTCGDAADGTTITGTLADGTRISNFSLVIDRVPNAFSLSPATETITPNSVTVANPTFTVAGNNAPAKIWGTFTTTGSTPQYTVDNGVTWNAIPTAPGTATVDNGQTVKIRFTTGAATGTEIFTLNVGASATAKQSGTFTVTVANAPFISSFTAGAPNASPASVNTASLKGTASCASWADGSTSLTSTGSIQFRVNAGAYGVGPTAVANTNTVDIIWNPTTIAAAADGAVLTGTLTNGVKTNTYTITVSRAVTGLAFTDLTNQSLSTAVTSSVITPAGFNVPATLTLAAGANPLTSLGVSIAGGPFVTSPQTVNPGSTLQLRGTTGAANSVAYSVLATMGSGPAATDDWSATTAAPIPSITTPSITSPANGATNLNPALNTPAGITLTGSAYTPLNGAGAVQTSSTWEVYKWVGGAGPVPPTLEPPGANYAAVTGSPFTVSSAPFTTVNVPQASLTVSSTHYARVQYATTNTQAATSAFSGWSSFGTASSFAVPVGTAYGGGYFAGQINDGGTIYNLVVAPITSGGLDGQYGGAVQGTVSYKTAGSADTPSATVQNQVYGGPTTDLFKASAAHPVFSTFINGATGPNAGAFDLTTGGAGSGTGIGGYNDWYLPAKYELEILYYNLKPDSQANTTASGSNPNAVPPRASNYTAGVPTTTTSVLFQTGNSEAFTAVGFTPYWSSSESSGSTGSTWRCGFVQGLQVANTKTSAFYARAIRRIAA